MKVSIPMSTRPVEVNPSLIYGPERIIHLCAPIQVYYILRYRYTPMSRRAKIAVGESKEGLLTYRTA